MDEYPLMVRISTAKIEESTAVGAVELQGGGRVAVLVENGVLCGSFSAKPTKLALVLDPQDEPVRSSAPSLQQDSPVERTFVRSSVLFGKEGVLLTKAAHHFELLWGGDCAEHERYLGEEHCKAAELVGQCEAPSQGYDSKTVLANGLNFGEISALAGDYYAHFDAECAEEIASAWADLPDYAARPTLCDASAEELARLKQITTGTASWLEKGFVTWAQQGVGLRYCTLALHNACHFAFAGPQEFLGNEPLALNASQTYEAYHEKALAIAAGANGKSGALNRALAVDAFGCHFLVDCFASGHMRVPRVFLPRKLGLVGKAEVLRMHNEDNEAGLWCTPRLQQTGKPRTIWRACGDGLLLDPVNADYLGVVQEAVCRSSAEVFTAHRDGEDFVPFEPRKKASAMIPVPLAPGECPQAGDSVEASGGASLDTPNHWPMYWFDSEGHVISRKTGATSWDDYRHYWPWRWHVDPKDCGAKVGALPGRTCVSV